MKKILVSLLGLFILLLIVIPAKSQAGKNVFSITTKSKAAKDLADKGTVYFRNIDMAQAYQSFSDAVKLDPDFTYALVFMKFLTKGETSNKYANKALKSAINKTEGEKLFASLADDKNKPEDYTTIWTKLHTMYPKNNLFESFYISNLTTPEERFAGIQTFIKKYPKDGPIYNSLGYYYMYDKKDMENAKKSFEKYMVLSSGYANPFDSMAEYYLTNGDTENAEKYYTKALEIYPFFNSSIVALDKIKADKKAKEEATK